MTRPRCAVHQCDQPVKWRLDGDNHQTWHACNKHAGGFANRLYPVHRTITQVSPYTPPPTQPQPEQQPTLF
jgi:hypothetical protein